MDNTFKKHISDHLYGKYIEARMSGHGDMFQMFVKGGLEIEQAVSGLTNIEASRTIRAGLKSAGRYLAKQGKKRLKERLRERESMRTGGRGKGGREFLRSYIQYERKKEGLLNSFVVRVKRRSFGALVGFKGGVGGGSHAHLVDRGTTRREHPITGHSGVMPANYFWTDTGEKDTATAFNILKESIGRAVTRIMLRRDY